MLALLVGRCGGWLSREWIGLPLAALPALAAAGLPLLRMPLLALAVLMATGSSYHLLRAALARRRYPAPGRFVLVDGRRHHLLAEGQVRKDPALLWIPGGYSQGQFFAHGHAALRDRTRSILFDPAGQGYSDGAPFPRSVERIVDELQALLEAAGEAGPFVLVGHSFGGLIGANFAFRHPQRVRGLICLDATPPDTLAYPSELRPGNGRAMLAEVLRCMFGLAWHRADAPVYEASYKPALAPWWPAIRANENRVSTQLSLLSAVIGAGLYPDWLVHTPAALGELPLLSITQPAQSCAQTRQDISRLLKLPPWKQDLLGRLLSDCDQQYLRLSSRAVHKLSPPGTGHNFPYQAPAFVLAEINAFLDGLPSA